MKKKKEQEIRKAFNFYRSYYSVAMELDDDNFISFMKALLQKEFEGIEPNLTGMAKFAYISQEHAINSQVEGYENKTGKKLNTTEGGSVGGSVGGSKGGSLQEKEKEKEKEKEEEKVQEQVKVKELDVELELDKIIKIKNIK
jgi:hypothetical protein